MLLIRNCYLLCFLILSSSAYCALERDFQSWFNLTTTGFFTKQDPTLKYWKYWLEGQERLGDDSRRITQELARLGIGYAINTSTSVWLGYAWIHSGEPLTTQPFAENRIWQQLLWVKTNPFFTLSSRTRTEQRFLENRPKTAYRIRELVKLSIPWKKDEPLSVIVSDEVFYYKNSFIGKSTTGFDQNRLFIGFGYKINTVTSTEIGYMNQYIRRRGDPNFLANILSLNLLLNF